jgi:hypothetical protein
MTTIVWDGLHLVGDVKRSREHNLCVSVQKVFKVEKPNLSLIANSHIITEFVDSHILFGSAGHSAGCVAFAEVISGRQANSISDKALFSFSAIIVTDKGRIFEIEDSLLAVEITKGNAFLTKFAIGSGAAYAMAAMECGKNGKEAIEIASKFDSHTSKESFMVSF